MKIGWELTEKSAKFIHHGYCESDYTRRQTNLYCMLFADISVNSQPIFMKFCKDYFRVTRRLPWNFVLQKS